MNKVMTNKEKGNCDDQLVAQYLADIQNIPLLNKEDEKYHAIRVQKYNDENSRNVLVTANLRFVILVAKQFRNCGIAFPDLIGEGNLGLFKAIERYKPERGVRFVTYAFWWIRQNIIKALSDHGRCLRMPVNRYRDLYNVKRILRILEQDSSEYTQLCKVAEYMGVSVRYINELFVTSAIAVSMDDPSVDTSSYYASEYGALQRSFQPDNDLMRKNTIDIINHLLSDLSQREQDILCSRYGLRNQRKRTLHEVGKLVNLSKERVRQIEKESLEKLKRKGVLHCLNKYL